MFVFRLDRFGVDVGLIKGTNPSTYSTEGAEPSYPSAELSKVRQLDAGTAEAIAARPRQYWFTVVWY